MGDEIEKGEGSVEIFHVDLIWISGDRYKISRLLINSFIY